MANHLQEAAIPAAQHLQVAGDPSAWNLRPPMVHRTIEPRSPFGFVSTRSDPRTWSNLEHLTEASKPNFTGPPLNGSFEQHRPTSAVSAVQIIEQRAQDLLLLDAVVPGAASPPVANMFVEDDTLQTQPHLLRLVQETEQLPQYTSLAAIINQEKKYSDALTSCVSIHDFMNKFDTRWKSTTLPNEAYA